MKASIWFSNTTSACSTVLYQSTICLNLLVRRTACANLAGTIFFDVLLPALPLMMRLLKNVGISPVTIDRCWQRGNRSNRWFWSVSVGANSAQASVTGSIRTEHRHDVVHPHRNQRCPVGRHPGQADKSTPGVRIGSSALHPHRPLKPGQNRRRAGSRLRTGPPRIRSQGSQVNDLPGQIHNAEKQVQLEKDFPASEHVDGQVEV